jgi:glutaredoxin-like protein NrdH
MGKVSLSAGKPAIQTSKPAVHTRRHPMIMVYALSTCPYCKMTKAFLDEKGIPYEHADVDLLEGEERETVVAKVKELSGGASFPVIVLDDGEVIVGFNKARLEEKLGEAKDG